MTDDEITDDELAAMKARIDATVNPEVGRRE
jgi:hypothetical protein